MPQSAFIWVAALALLLIGIAFLVAAVVLRVRQPNFLIDTTSYLFVVTSGVLFPIAVLPAFLKFAAFALPTTYGLDLLRAGALGTSPLLPVVWEYAALGVIAAGLVAIGRWTFLRTERRLRVQGSLGVGIYCNDHSMCMVDKNRVTGTRSDAATGDRTRAGYGLEVSFGAEAEVGRNDLAHNPARVGVFLGSLVTRMDS